MGQAGGSEGCWTNQGAVSMGWSGSGGGDEALPRSAAGLPWRTEDCRVRWGPMLGTVHGHHVWRCGHMQAGSLVGGEVVCLGAC